MIKVKWTHDEVVLALDFFFSHRMNQRIPGKNSAAILELSSRLKRMGEIMQIPHDETYRNPAGVFMQVNNFAFLDPDWTRTQGIYGAGKMFREVWNVYADKPDEVAGMAQSILAHMDKAEKSGEPLLADISDRDIDMLTPSIEGRVLQVSHLRRERNPRLVEKLKDLRFDANGLLDCEVCAFDYERSYGERGHKFMEAHQKKPLSTLKPEGEKVTPEDYALICANCHRMIHRYSPWWSVEELRGQWNERR